jgi:hypothetical protein
MLSRRASIFPAQGRPAYTYARALPRPEDNASDSCYCSYYTIGLDSALSAIEWRVLIALPSHLTRKRARAHIQLTLTAYAALALRLAGRPTGRL